MTQFSFIESAIDTTDDPAEMRAAEKRRARWLSVEAKTAKRLVDLTIGLGVVAGVLATAQAWYTAKLFGDLVDGEGLSTTLIGLLIVLILARAATGAVAEFAGIRAGQIVSGHVRERLLSALLKLGPAWGRERRSGEVVSTVIEQTDAVEGFVSRYLPAQALAGVLPVLMVATVIVLDWRSGLILLGFGLAVPVVMALVGWRTAARARGQMTAMRRMSGYFLDRLQNLTTLKLFGAEWRERDRIRAVSDAFRKRTMGVLHLAFLSSTALELLAGLAIASVAISLVAGVARADLVTILFVILLVPEIFMPLRKLGQHYHDRAAAVGAAEAILEILDAEGEGPAIAETMDWDPEQSAPEIVLESVSLAYENGARPALENVTLNIASGSFVALTGESGSGKSSLLDILVGFRDPDTGTVRMNGQRLDAARLLDHGLRARIAWAGQAPRILSDTLSENLRLGRHDADEVRLWQALETAGLTRLAEALPEKLETVVGEAGRGLSGGEARRVALARVLVRDAPLVLLDEPTANLDADSETGVLAAIDALKGARTIIVATHSQKVMARADRVVRLERGRIVDDTSSQCADPARDLRAEGVGDD